MRYHLESTLPIHAFQPVGGRHSPFKRSMTLEGGGGGGIISAITDPISDVLGTSGGGGGILGAIEDVGQSIGSALADVDKAVGDTVPGGWGTVAAIAVPYLAPEALMGSLASTLGSEAAASAALSAGTSAATGAIQGKDPEDILKGAALAGLTSYGLGSLGGENIDLPSETPYIDMPDGAKLLTPDSISLEEAIKLPTSVNPDDIYTDQFIRAFENPQISELPAFEPTASVVTSDVPTPLVKTAAEESLTSTGYTPTLEEEIKRDAFFNDLINKPSSTYTSQGVQIFDRSTPADAATQKMVETGYLERMAELPGATYDMAKSYVTNYPLTTIGTVLGIAGLAGEGPLGGIGQKLGTAKLLGGSSPQSGGSQAPVPPKSSKYTGGYGVSGGLEDPYLLRERINAANIYNYRNPYTSRYAKGGEVKHFAFGGISNALTRAFQPIEKGIVQPIGQAVPFLREAAPYAGLLAAPFIASPIAAAGIGGLASGFGRPGSGFDMKRALMGGIAAYSASTLGAGLEAAGTTPSTVSSAVPNFDADITASVQKPLTEAVSKPFFRSPEVVGRGIGNLLSPSTYDQAAANFGTQAGIYKTGVPLVIGTSGMMAVDEAQKMREEADIAAAASKGEQQEMLARIAKGRRRAEEAVRANPYMYAVGGSVDDESGSDEAIGLFQGNLTNGLFGGGMPSYAAGGTPRFLSGGGDGMSDSIPATIGGTQEARLADGEFVIPADVVSHLGNGSSKAGAKQLYSMMDRVRKARTGNEKQGRQINPKKLMPA